MNDVYLMHYGVQGQKWGVRRYQNKDGSLTAQGRKHARAELKSENRLAYSLGRETTLYGRALAKSTKKMDRAVAKAERVSEKDAYGTRNRTRRLQQKADIEKTTNEILSDRYNKSLDKAKSHVDFLISKYGSERVTGLKYKEVKAGKGKKILVADEKIHDGRDYVTSALISGVGLMSANAFGYGVVAYPASKRSQGNRVYNSQKRTVKLAKKRAPLETTTV